MEKISIIVSEAQTTKDQGNNEFTEYVIQVQVGLQIWPVKRRYNKFYEIHCASPSLTYTQLKTKFPKMDFPEFPRKQIFHNKDDVEARRQKLQKYLQETKYVNMYRICNFKSYTALQMGTSKPKKVLIPLPDSDFDPTEVTACWHLMDVEGYNVTFATERGLKAQPDEQKVKPSDIASNILAAEYEIRELYKDVEQSSSFANPITWDMIIPNEYDGLFLTGGDGIGMKPYLESHVLQVKISEFWKLNRPVAAIGQGVLLLARSKDETGKSVLFERNTTCFPKYMETIANKLMSWKHKEQYALYSTPCELDVKSFLVNPKQFKDGPTTLTAKGTALNDSNTFVVEDGNYLSARWAGGTTPYFHVDSFAIAHRFTDKLYEHDTQ